MIRIVAALLCLALLGCVESPVPLEFGSPARGPALSGIWKGDFRGDPMVATIRRDRSGRWFADVLGYSGPGPAAATTRYELVLSQSGDLHYMSIRDKNTSPNYSLARYEFIGKNRFCLFATFSDSLAAAIETNVLPGKIKDAGHFSTVELGATSDQLRDWFATHGVSAFNEQDDTALVFERASSAVLPPPKGPENDPEHERITPCRP